MTIDLHCHLHHMLPSADPFPTDWVRRAKGVSDANLNVGNMG
jgi:hypothetical protein